MRVSPNGPGVEGLLWWGGCFMADGLQYKLGRIFRIFFRSFEELGLSYRSSVFSFPQSAPPRLPLSFLIPALHPL